MKKIFSDKRILFVYFIVILLLIMGTTFALQSTSLGFNVNTSIVKVDETAYGSTTFDSSNLDFRPILDTDVESSVDNVISIDFKVGGNEQNNNNNIIYDIALTDLELNCELLSPYLKWKLVKNGTEISNGSLDYQFDTIVDGRLVLTTIQQDLPDYSADEVGYDDYQFYLWLSDSCQDDISTCISNNNLVDQSSLIGKNLSGKIEVELYTEGKKELVRNPKSSLDATTCQEKYLVEFNYEGGSGSLTSKYVTNGTLYGTLPTPSRDAMTVSYDTGGADSLNSDTVHYTFDGWYLSNQFQVEELVTKDTTVNTTINHKLYAKWSGAELTLPNITKDGFLFQGWYSDSAFTNKVGNAGDKYVVTENLTLYAKWKTNILTLTLNNNGGSGGSSTIYLDYGAGYCSDSTCQNTITSVSIPTRTGYVFNGYDGLTDASGNIIATNIQYSSDTTIPAKWTANTYTISYNLNGGSSGANAPTSGTYDQVVEITNPTKTITVTGNENGTGATVGTATSKAQNFSGWTSSSSDGLDTINAKTGTSSDPTTDWTGSTTKNTYFKNLRSSNGTVTMTANWTGTVTLPTVTKTGYTCKWYENSNGTGTAYDSGGSYTPSTNSNTSITMYAQCTANTYTVKFNGNGSTSGSTSSKTCTYDQDCVLTSNGFSKTGYSFNGWATSSTGDKVYDNGATVNNLVTSGTYNLYATWTANSYTIAYALNGGTSGTNAPTSGIYDQDVQISNPTKTITITGNENGTGATVGTTSGVQEFSGWTSGASGGLDTTNAKTGTSSNPTTAWTGSTTKNEFFKNLRSSSGTVTMTANWTPVSFTLPTVSKTGNTCNWNTNASGTGTSYESGETYTPTSTTAASITLYAQCTPNEYIMTYRSNIIPNSDFAAGARDWNFNTFGNLDTSVKYNGMNSVRITTSSNGFDGIRNASNMVSYKANTTYRISVKAYRDSSSSYGDLTKALRVYIPEYKSDGTVLSYRHYIDIKSSNLPDKTWTEFSAEFTTDASDGTSFKNGMFLDFTNVEGTSTIWIADPKVEEIHTETKTYGTAFETFPSVAKAIHTLDGWYTEENGGGSKITTSSTVPAEDTTYYANWNLAQYTLTVNPNGGTYNGSTGTTTHTQEYDSTKSIVNPTVPAAYTITYNANGGSVSTTSVTTNKKFDGWTLSSTYGQYKTLSSPSVYSAITRTYTKDSNGAYEKFTYSVSAPTSNTWYDVQYPGYSYTSGHTYDIRFKINVTSMSTSSLQLRHSAFANDFGTAGRVTKTISATTGGYQPVVMSRTIKGTTMTLSGTDKTVAPQFEIYTSNLNGLTDNVTFYVRDLSIIDRNSLSLLQANSNTYWYRGNGTLTASYSGSTSVTLPTPTRAGYTFNGWYTASSGGTKVGAAGASYTPTAKITLYAQWTANYLYKKSVGSYVSYTGNNGCTGNTCKGIGPTSCFKSGTNYNYKYTGWRIMKVASNTVYLVSAGAVECICTKSNGTYGSGPLTANKCSSYENTANVPKHFANMNSRSIKYCNATYAYGGACNSSSARAMSLDDASAILGKTINKSSECYNSSSVISTCGKNSTLINNGGNYWLTGTCNNQYPIFWSTLNYTFGSSHSDEPRGLRPVIRLKSNVLVTGGSGTSGSPYTITVG